MKLKKILNAVCIVLVVALLAGALAQIMNIDFDFNFGGGGGGGGNLPPPVTEPSPPSLAELKSKYEFTYYTDLSTLKTDLDGSTTVTGSKQEQTDSSCAVYYDSENERSVVVLLKDISIIDPYIFDMPLEINFAGNTLSCTGRSLRFNDSAYINGRLGGGIVCSGNADVMMPLDFRGGTVQIDGGSYTVNAGETSVDAKVIQITDEVVSGSIRNAKVSVKYAGSSSDTYKAGITSVSPLTMKNVDVQVESEQDLTTRLYGVYVGANASISDCRVSCIPGGEHTTVYGIVSIAGTLQLTDNIVYTDAAENEAGGEKGVAIAVQITSAAEQLIINGGDYTGTHSAISAGVPIRINGGRFVSCAHGGVYFSATDQDNYIQNATIGCVEYAGTFDQSTMGNPAPLGAFYIGGSQGRDNVRVYMDSCTILPLGRWSGIVRGSSGETGGKLFISNTNLPDGIKLRIDNGNYCIAGENTNITTDNVVGSSSNNPVSENQLTYTSFCYTYENRDQYLYTVSGDYKFNLVPTITEAMKQSVHFTSNGEEYTQMEVVYTPSIGYRLFYGDNEVYLCNIEDGAGTWTDEAYRIVSFGSELQPLTESFYQWFFGNSANYGKNLIPFPYHESSKTKNGITFTVNDDGSVIVNGTNTSTGAVFLALGMYVNVDENKTYTLSGCPANGNVQTYSLNIMQLNTDANTFVRCIGTPVSFTAVTSSLYEIVIRIGAGVTIENLTFYPMLNEGLSAVPYEPYVPEPEEIGVNLFDVGSIEDYFVKSEVNMSISGNTIHGTIFKDNAGRCINLKNRYAPGTYTVDADFSNGVKRFLVRLFDQDGNILTNEQISLPGLSYNTAYGGWNNSNGILTITIPDEVAYWSLGFVFSGSDSHPVGSSMTISNIMLVEGNKAFLYQPYIPKQPDLSVLTEVLDSYGLTVDDQHSNKIVWNSETGKVEYHQECIQIIPTPEMILLDSIESHKEEGYSIFGFSLDVRCANNILICNRFNKVSHVYATKGKEGIGTNSEGTHCYIKIAGTYTLEQFRALLTEWSNAGDPLTIVFGVAEPEITDITDLIPTDHLVTSDIGFEDGFCVKAGEEGYFTFALNSADYHMSSLSKIEGTCQYEVIQTESNLLIVKIWDCTEDSYFGFNFQESIDYETNTERIYCYYLPYEIVNNDP